MYRAVALYALQHHLISREEIDIDELHRSLDGMDIRFVLNPVNGLQETWLDGKNVEEEIRGVEVSDIVSKISQVKEVRAKMVGLQRKIGERHSVVMDGRDIGTTVFPAAVMKIFMTAEPAVRAERRYKELRAKGISIELEEVVRNISMRDHEDESRRESPLRKAVDALVLDNSKMTVAQQMEWFRLKWKEITEKNEH